ncbi:MAG: excinuclease ABC subunit UvrB [Candidatus Woesebacteria bacterium]|jgi:excinuclease ABC subunit B
MSFQLQSAFKPTGDQPEAIAQLTAAFEAGKEYQTLLGVTGSGKTFTMANLIQNLQKPTLVIAHNKTLAAQLYQEFRDFFPNNAVNYFVSYYDYYQPEAYLPASDTYIEKEAQINDEIDKLRLASTTNLLTRPDVIIIASVSCIYNLGSPIEYGSYILEIIEGEIIARNSLLLHLTELQYERSTTDLRRGTYRLRGDIIQIWPAYSSTALKIDTLENQIVSIEEIDPISGTKTKYLQNKAQIITPQKSSKPKRAIIYPAKHYIVNPQTQIAAIEEIRQDLKKRLKELKAANKIIEAYRLEQKVNYDLEMIQEFGFVNGIENYSRYFDGRQAGDPPFTLLDYFKENQKRFKQDSFLTIIDESHMTIPQIRGMYNGDQARKKTLIEYGFRLPSAMDNRPLQFNEFLSKTSQSLAVSATPNDWEIKQSNGKVVEQLVRPTGLLDPAIDIRSSKGQIENLIKEIIKRVEKQQRVLVTTLTKKMAEALTDYLNDTKKIKKLVNTDLVLPKVAYLHSDVETLERSDILADLRKGKYDVLVGINLLREGLDLPEVSLVAILDADKEGFLRSTTSLIQTMGRAARHENGTVILYADKITKSMKAAIDETKRRRAIQQKYNRKHGITPTTIDKPIKKRMIEKKDEDSNCRLGKKGKKAVGSKKPIFIQLNKKETIDLNQVDADALTPADRKKLAQQLRRKMNQAAKDLDFELATVIRDVIRSLGI